MELITQIHHVFRVAGNMSAMSCLIGMIFVNLVEYLWWYKPRISQYPLVNVAT